MTHSHLCCHRFGDYPEADPNSYLNDCSSTLLGSYEGCYMDLYYTMTLYVAVEAYQAYSDLTITCTQYVGSGYDSDYWGVGEETSQLFCASKVAAIVGAGIIGAWMLVMM